jgi:hypothetical protein
MNIASLSSLSTIAHFPLFMMLSPYRVIIVGGDYGCASVSIAHMLCHSSAPPHLSSYQNIKQLLQGTGDEVRGLNPEGQLETAGLGDM